MKLSTTIGFSGDPQRLASQAKDLEAAGIDRVWGGEIYGFDLVSTLAFLAGQTERLELMTGILPVYSRSPALIAQTAATIDALSNGRFVLGLGTSGPQVIEGWHGVRFDKPVTRTKETIEIIRLISRGERLQYDGEVYQLPLPDSQGKAIRPAAPAAEIPVYVASLGPNNLRLTGALADGWIGNSFFCETADVFFDEIRAGAESAGRSLSDVELTVSVGCEITDDVEEAARRHSEGFAFTFGAMGSAKSNFYNDAFARQGWADDVNEVQRLWLAGDREAAAKRVPLEIGLGTNLIGPPDEIRRRLRQYRDCGVNLLRISPMGETLDDRLAGIGELLDLINDVNGESG